MQASRQRPRPRSELEAIRRPHFVSKQHSFELSFCVLLEQYARQSFYKLRHLLRFSFFDHLCQAIFSTIFLAQHWASGSVLRSPEEAQRHVASNKLETNGLLPEQVTHRRRLSDAQTVAPRDLPRVADATTLAR